MKNWCLYLITMLLLASCSEQQMMEETLSSQKLTEQKGMTISPQDSIKSLLNQARWGDGSAYLKLADCYRDGIGVKKDFFGMITMAHMAEWRGAINRMAELLLTIPDWKGRLRADATKLGIIAHRVPLAYLILGDLYYEPDDNGKSNKQLAVEYYMKAEEHAVLDRHGAERVLDYYRNGGNVQLTEDDIKRLELIVQPKDVETE